MLLTLWSPIAHHCLPFLSLEGWNDLPELVAFGGDCRAAPWDQDAEFCPVELQSLQPPLPSPPIPPSPTPAQFHWLCTPLGLYLAPSPPARTSNPFTPRTKYLFGQRTIDEFPKFPMGMFSFGCTCTRVHGSIVVGSGGGGGGWKKFSGWGSFFQPLQGGGGVLRKKIPVCSLSLEKNACVVNFCCMHPLLMLPMGVHKGRDFFFVKDPPLRTAPRDLFAPAQRGPCLAPLFRDRRESRSYVAIPPSFGRHF